MRARLAERLPNREVPTVRALRRTGTGEAIEAAVSETFGVSRDVLRQRGRWHNEARAVAVYVCRKWTGAPEGELGRRFGGLGGAAISRTVRQVAERLRRDRRLARRVGRYERAFLDKQKVEN